MSEKTEKLRQMIRDEIKAAKDEESKKKLDIKDDVTEGEVERALASLEKDSEKEYKCPGKDCDYSSDKPFNPCPKCGAGVKWE